jgi:hypothetical protein
LLFRSSHENRQLENDEGRKSNCPVRLAANGSQRSSDRLTRSSYSYTHFVLRNHFVEEDGKSASFSVVSYVVKIKKFKFVLCDGVSELRLDGDTINTDTVRMTL